MKALLLLAAIGILSAPHSKPKSPEQIWQECVQTCIDHGTAELHKCNQVLECENYVEHQYNLCIKACLSDD